MNIKQIKQLEDGVKGLIVSGQVGYAGKPKEITGERNGEPYHFWTQFITVKDDTDEIGVSLQIPNGQSGCVKGQQVTITNGRLESYIDKNGNPAMSIRGKLGQPQQQTPKTAAPVANKPNSSADTPEMRYRAMAQAYAKDLVVAGKINLSDMEDRAERIFSYIVKGVQPKPKAVDELDEYFNEPAPHSSENDDEIPPF